MEKQIRVSLDLSEEQHNKLRELAKKDERSLNAYIRVNVIKEHLENLGSKTA